MRITDQLREIRNLVSHEYPDKLRQRAEGLNELWEQSEFLETTLDKVTSFIRERDLL